VKCESVDCDSVRRRGGKVNRFSQKSEKVMRLGFSFEFRAIFSKK